MSRSPRRPSARPRARAPRLAQLLQQRARPRRAPLAPSEQRAADLDGDVERRARAVSAWSSSRTARPGGRARASRRTARTSEVLPTPASPPTSTSRPPSRAVGLEHARGALLARGDRSTRPWADSDRRRPEPPRRVRLACMRAALIRELGALPEAAEADAPDGDDVVEVVAAPLNPIDLAVSRGVLATGHPELPYVPGCEAVGRTADGRLVWIFGGALGRTRTGRSRSARRSATRTRSRSPTAPTRLLAGGARDRRARGLAPVRLACAARGRRVGARARRDGLGRARRRPDGEAPGRGQGRRGGPEQGRARTGGSARSGRDAPTRRAGRPRRRVPGRVRRRRAELRLRSALGPAGRGCRRRRQPLAPRSSTSASRRERPRARLRAGAVQEPLDPRSHELLRAPRRAGRALLAARRATPMAGEIELEVERVPLEDVADAWQRQADGAGHEARRRALDSLGRPCRSTPPASSPGSRSCGR